MWYFLASWIVTSLPLSTCIASKSISVLSVTGVFGGSVSLPCDVSHPPDDTIYLLLWFRDSLTTPIYRFDDRALARGKQSHWADDDQLGSRARLDVSSSPALLRLSKLTMADQGLYRCRVDFKFQPTKTTRISLTVVVPPKGLSIVVDGPGAASRPVSRVVGPYLEGDTIALTCIAHGGNPPAKVVWYEDGLTLDRNMESEIPEIETDIPEMFLNTTGSSWPTKVWPTAQVPFMVPSGTSDEEGGGGGEPYNTVVLGPLTRSDLKRVLTCEGTNNNITLPLSLVVNLDMNLPPLSVVIRPPEEPMTAGREYQIMCEVRGTRPPPRIHWWNGDQKLPQAMHTQTSGDGNITTSILILKPTSEDDGSPLKCMAESQPTNSSVEETLILTVYYLPTALATFGSSLDSSNIKESDDVYFECVIKANPRVTHVSWKHNNVVLDHDVSGGVIVSNQSLVLQKVIRSQAGKYTCHAHNIIGLGDSNTLQLDVKYAPVCSPNQVTTYAVGRYEDAEVTCSVEANPLEATFQWTFNNTADTIDVPQGRYTSTSSHSVITYTPMTSLDYGTLLCWASNEIGTQKEPCLYHIVPAGKPDPPGNCTVSQKTRISVRINCISGNSGGLKQFFFLQATLHNGKHILNVTADNPIFQVDGLKPKQKYNLLITAHNDKGSSPPTHLAISSIGTSGAIYQPHDGPSEAEVRDGGKTGNGGANPDGNLLETTSLPHLMPAALGVGAGLVLVIIILIFLIIFRTRRPRYFAPPMCGSVAGSELSKNSSSKSPSMTPKPTTSCSERDAQLESESDDAEPDLIPLQEGGTLIATETVVPAPATLLPPDCYQYPAVTSAPHVHTLISPHHSNSIIPPSPATVPLLEECFTEPLVPGAYPVHHEHHPPHHHHHHHHHHHPHYHHHADHPPTSPISPVASFDSHPALSTVIAASAVPPPLSPLAAPQGYGALQDPHNQPFPGIEGNLPPPAEYQTAQKKRVSYGRVTSNSVACEEDAPTTPLLNKRESSV